MLTLNLLQGRETPNRPNAINPGRNAAQRGEYDVLEIPANDTKTERLNPPFWIRTRSP